MHTLAIPEPETLLAGAMDLMAEALELLDDIGAPGEIGANLDLAMTRLENVLGRDQESTAAPSVVAGLECEAASDKSGCPVSNPWRVTPS